MKLQIQVPVCSNIPLKDYENCNWYWESYRHEGRPLEVNNLAAAIDLMKNLSRIGIKSIRAIDTDGNVVAVSVTKMLISEEADQCALQYRNLEKRLCKVQVKGAYSNEWSDRTIVGPLGIPLKKVGYWKAIKCFLESIAIWSEVRIIYVGDNKLAPGEKVLAIGKHENVCEITTPDGVRSENIGEINASQKGKAALAAYINSILQEQ